MHVGRVHWNLTFYALKMEGFRIIKSWIGFKSRLWIIRTERSNQEVKRIFLSMKLNTSDRLDKIL